MAVTKRIFISDLHLGTERNVETHCPYCWLDKHAKHLARFLGQLARRNGVHELVILGDMLDDWVIPANFDPDPSSDYQSAFDAICRAGRATSTSTPTPAPGWTAPRCAPTWKPKSSRSGGVITSG